MIDACGFQTAVQISLVNKMGSFLQCMGSSFSIFSLIPSPAVLAASLLFPVADLVGLLLLTVNVSRVSTAFRSVRRSMVAVVVLRDCAVDVLRSL
jgi:hypothetical protein